MRPASCNIPAIWVRLAPRGTSIDSTLPVLSIGVLISRSIVAAPKASKIMRKDNKFALDSLAIACSTGLSLPGEIPGTCRPGLLFLEGIEIALQNYSSRDLVHNFSSVLALNPRRYQNFFSLPG